MLAKFLRMIARKVNVSLTYIFMSMTSDLYHYNHIL
jgi:hypothetical protein